MRVYALAPEPIGELSRWLAELGRAWRAQLDAFKDYVALRGHGEAGRG